ncbi:MAG: 6-phosphofructokinase, partial [Candidatus Shikimatogenerans sp. JK-2022]|nr:6-phosphofructokinase [Candidatus Shikimatogenerans bostrichidophilus]
YKNLLVNNINGLIVIGGNGTLKGINIFSKEYNFPIISIPGTIDNDIYGTDLTLGYDTALNTIVKSIEEIKNIAVANNRIFIIEVMGKNSPYLAYNSGLTLNALSIIYNNDYNKNIKHIKNKINKKYLESHIIIVAENKIFGNSSKFIYKKLKNIITNYELRHTILGYIQRGGVPTCLDRILGIKFGIRAVNELIKYKNNIVIGIRNNKIVTIKLTESISKKNKKISYLNL